MSDVSLSQYWDILNRHDWTYMMSDDGEVYRRGDAEHHRVKKMAEQSEAHKALFDGFYRYIWSGEHMGTEKAPKPERPE